jgi:GT2 family glycosyltransferase
LSQTSITVELIIPSYNRLTVLKRTLSQIRTLYPALKICLGLQGDMPDVQWQSELDKDPLLRIERIAPPCTTATLNQCIRSSHADIVLILDDDATPHFGWLETHQDAFLGDPTLIYTSGRVIEFTRARSSFSDWFRIMVEWSFGIFIGKDKKITGRPVGWMNWIGLSFTNQHLPGICTINSPREGNMGIRRSLFIDAGGFNNAFVGNAWGFGADFGLRMAKNGNYGKYVGDAIIIHHEAPSGGTRSHNVTQWFKDFLHNQSFVIGHLGTQAWIGSIPRIIKHVIRILLRL